MNHADPGTDNDAMRALYDLAHRCKEPRLRGTILALASCREGVSFAEAVRIWDVAPDRLQALADCFDTEGLDGVRRAVVGTRPDRAAAREPGRGPATR